MKDKSGYEWVACLVNHRLRTGKRYPVGQSNTIRPSTMYDS